MRITIILLFSIGSAILCGWAMQDVWSISHKNRVVTVNLEDNARHLRYAQRNLITIKTQNILRGTLSVSARGLKLVKGDSGQNSSVWEITPLPESVKNDTLKLWFAVRSANDSIWKDHFKIPVK